MKFLLTLAAIAASGLLVGCIAYSAYDNHRFAQERQSYCDSHGC